MVAPRSNYLWSQLRSFAPYLLYLPTCTLTRRHALARHNAWFSGEFVLVLFGMKEKYKYNTPGTVSFRSASDNLTLNGTTSPSMLRAHARFLEPIPQHLRIGHRWKAQWCILSPFLEGFVIADKSNSVLNLISYFCSLYLYYLQRYQNLILEFLTSVRWLFRLPLATHILLPSQGP